ncbi:MAG TPA: helix-turn-helix domain-containing protein [Terriglobia bacterium]|nr:helix-turn-helix domain-containing protein [Terriglobia bacterium]
MGNKAKPLSAEALHDLEVAMAGTGDKLEYQRALCVWLPAALGLTVSETARAVGWSAPAVNHARRVYRRTGVRGLRDKRLRPLAPDAVAELAAAQRRASSATESRRIMCVSLRAILGLTGKQVAAALGWPIGTVSNIQYLYMRRGLAGLLPGPGALLVAGEPLDKGPAERLRTIMDTARTVPEYCTALCLMMRVVLGMNAGLVAQVLGWQLSSVSHFHRQYLRHGDAVLRGPGRGGKRWRILTVKQEDEVLRELASARYDYGFLMFPVIHKAVEAKAGRPVPVAYVNSILDRHGWIRAAVVMVPRRNYRPIDVEGWHIDPNHPSRRRATWR